MTQLDTSQTLTLIPMDPEALGRLLEDAAERCARRALAEQAADGFLSSEQTAALLGYRRADGRPNVTAFKSFRQRHPEFSVVFHSVLLLGGMKATRSAALA